MSHIDGKVYFYGIDDLGDRLDKIISDLKLKNNDFEVKLILSEAVTNAFVHGNNSDKDKPICVLYELQDQVLTVEVQDCGCGYNDNCVPKNADDIDVFDESGRGLFIISNYADEVKFSKSSIIMKKMLINEVAV